MPSVFPFSARSRAGTKPPLPLRRALQPARTLAARRALQPPVAAVAAALALSLSGCRSPEEATPQFTELFELVTTLRVSPIEPLARIPSSVVVLPDGRILIPEAGGVWLHVADATGQGVTRLGGASDVTLGTSQARLGRFRSVSGVAVRPDGGLVVGDRTSNVLTLFDSRLEPADTVIVPETRGVLQLEADAERIVAAVEPLNPAAGGQVVVLGPADSVRGFLAQDRIVVHNRWEAVASTGIEVLGDGRVLAYWSVFPWAEVLSPHGEARPRIGGFSPLYKAPSSGPRNDAPVEVLRRWYGSFTPLLAVESAESILAFEYLEAEEGPGAGRTVSPSAAIAAQDSDRKEQPRARDVFVNLYDASGKVLARDLRLPERARILKSNDSSRFYLLTHATPRELRIDVLRPDPARLAAARRGG